MKFEPITCSECSYPPNFIISSGNDNGQKIFFIKCRDCGDCWEEADDSDDE
jgi:hypothetical protein